MRSAAVAAVTVALVVEGCGGGVAPGPVPTPATETPPPTSPATPAPTATPTPTATTTATPTVAATPTSRATATPTVAATPTSRATPTPAATPTPDATTAFRYDTYDTAGAVATAGSYAFLSGEDGASVVTTYEGLRDGTTTALLIHKSDADGTSQADVYGEVAEGHLIEWLKTDDCFVRYRVTDVPAAEETAAYREFGVRAETYVFQGCQAGSLSAGGSEGASGTATTAMTFTVATELPLEHLGGANLADFAVVHGPWQFAPGASREPGMRAQPRGDVSTKPFLRVSEDAIEIERRTRTLRTTELNVARGLPAWREPAAGALPTDWTFALALGGEANGYNYAGYAAVWTNADGYTRVEIEGDYVLDGDRGGASVSSYTTNQRKLVVKELRTIAGRPAWVTYSPLGAQHSAFFPVKVSVYDAATESVYRVHGTGGSLLGGPSAAEKVVAIACSLFWSKSECAQP